MLRGRWARLILGMFALLVLGVATIWIGLTASLPTLDGLLSVSSLTRPATIERDANGIPTITAANRTDLGFVTGFAHAQDRFFQMDLIRRDAAGELSALVGPAAIELDKRRRFHQFRRRALAAIESLPATDRALLDSYVAGVNAGLESLGARPPEYWLLRQSPQPWQPEDTFLVVYAMYLQLNDSRARKDVRRGFVHAALPTDFYRWLYPTHTSWDAPIQGEQFERPQMPSSLASVLLEAGGRDAGMQSGFEQSLPPMNGSNNWAVSGELTAEGGALVANDMHLGLSVPNIWYRARLRVDGEQQRDISGVTLPGTPFVVAGSNGHIAWGYTNSYGDWSDAVLVKPGSKPDTYLSEDGELKIERVTERIDVAGEESVDYEIRQTRWGPIDDQLLFAGQQLAISWIAHYAEATNFALLELETARDVESALTTANRMGTPPQNLVVGDEAGNIGWTIAGPIPQRGNYDPRLPADWSEQDGWNGWLAPDAYPRVINPANQRIWTANARVVDGEALRIIGDGGYDLGARATQIRDVLFEKNSFSPKDMLELQRDHRALFLAPWRELLLDVTNDLSSAPELTEYRELVLNWIPAASPESVGYRLVRAFRLQTHARLFAHLTAPVKAVFGDDANPLMSERFEAAVWDMVSQRPAHLLPDGYASWDDFLRQMLREVNGFYQDRFSGPLTERRWGELNTVQVEHPISPQLPLLARWLDMSPVALPGDQDLPLAQGRSFGASERFSVTPGDEESGLMQMPAGQSGHPLSPFYSRGHQDWVEGRPAAFLPGETRYTLRLSPEPR